MEEVVENPSQNITKLVINNQSKTELHKSPPIKTYGKKLETDSTNESRSRYGRERKHNTCSDFLSTDHRLSSYLKQETVKDAVFKKDKKCEKVKTSPVGGAKKARGRPRKSMPDLTQNSNDDKELLNRSLPIDIITDYQAPVPTCTETLPLPTELNGIKVEFDQDQDEEEIFHSDWNCGDLAWASVPSYPYWPCAITRDPVEGTYIKQANIGRSVKPRTLLHVRFFGDNGRRSWVKASYLMNFTGLDDYQTLVQQTFTPKLKKTDLKKYKMFNVSQSQRKCWQAAVSEAESLLASPRSERILYFENLYPSLVVKSEPEEEPLPHLSNKKRKVEQMVTSYSIPVIEKKVKLDVNRYSIDLETLALQAAPITPRAIYTKSSSVKQKSPVKRQYVKRSEHWLSCNNKIINGIVASQEPHVVLNRIKTRSPKDIRMESQVKNIILNSSCDDNKEELDDDFAVPPAADCPLVPASAIKLSSETIKESSPVVTHDEFETVKDVTSIEFDSTKEPILVPVTPNVDNVVEDISMTELSPVETDQPMPELVETDQPMSEKVVDKGSENEALDEVQTPKNHKVAPPTKLHLENDGLEMDAFDTEPSGETPKSDFSNIKTNHVKKAVTPKTPKTGSAKSKKVAKTPEIKSPETSPGKKRGRPRKYPVEVSPPKTPTPKKLPAKAEKLTPSKTSLRTPVKKTNATPEPKKEFKTPKSNKISKSQSKKPKISSSRDDSLEVRKFGYKGSKVFKKFLEKNFDDIVMERPDLSVKDVEKYIEDLWLTKSEAARQKFKSKIEAEASEEFVVDKEMSDKPEVPLALPSNAAKNPASKKIPSLFYGLKDRVCQICLKEDNLFRCKGPCNGYYHKECGDERKPIVDVDDDDETTSKKKRGRKKSTVLNKSGSEKSSDDVLDGDKVCNGSGDGENKSDENMEIEPTEASDNSDVTKSGPLEVDTRSKSSLDSKMISEDCEKENVLPCNSTLNKQLTRIKSIDRSVRTQTQPTKAESVSSDDSNKSDDCKSESEKTCESDDESRKSGKDLQKAKKAENESENGKIESWKCRMCREKVEDSCFACRKEKSNEKLLRCSIGYCGLSYHLSCIDVWPQTVVQNGAKGRTVLTCPQHACHTCISDNPKANTPKYNIDRLVKCLYCPTSYHHTNYCVPAGSEILSNYQIICPRHYTNNSKSHHVNAAWCFLCSVGGSLICCDLCPNSFHVECLKIPSPEGSFICEDCETGRYPLFGEIVWVKLGAYRWWPAKILFPSEIPLNINQLAHKRGEFAIKFFGSHDHYWINRGRVFLYHEGDGENIVASKSRVDKIFNKAMVEAREAYTAFALERDQREAINKSVLKPPKYFKISKNVCQSKELLSLLKPAEGCMENCTPCECKPEQESPCGPNSDCINRLLMIECNPTSCPAKEKCLNQNFEKRLYPSLSPFMTDNRGWGLKTNENVKKGDFIIEYVGEMIDADEYHKRVREMQRNKNENYYFLTVDSDIMLDAGPKGNVARFMNHSCDPNCETQKWNVNGVTRVGLFALHDIAKDTELVFNYQFETKSKVACKCGAKTCTGFIGGQKSVNKSTNDVKKAEVKKNKSKKLKKLNKNKVMNDYCFTCSEGGSLLLCDAPNCPNSYHLSCLGLTKEPSGEWMCPVHQCSVCNHPKVKRCALCINSYCNKHSLGNITKHKIHGLICNNHALSDYSSEAGMDLDTKVSSSSKSKTKSEDEHTTASQPDQSTEIPLVNGHSST